MDYYQINEALNLAPNTPLHIFIPFGLWLLGLLIPVVLVICAFFKDYWFRQEFDPILANKFQDFKWLKMTGYNPEIQEKPHGVMLYLGFDGILNGVLAFVFGIFLYWTLANPVILIIALIIVTILVLPRYVVDIITALRYNFKTRDSDRLVKLEQEIADIKAIKR